MKYERKQLKVKGLPSGDSLMVNYYTLEGDRKGPEVYVQSSVHGAELQGNAVIFHLMEFLKSHPFAGKFTFVPLANPYAANQKLGGYTYGRFNPVTGHNWNRLYTDFNPEHREETGFSLRDFVREEGGGDPGDLAKKYKGVLLKTWRDLLDKKREYGVSANEGLLLELQVLAGTADIVLDLHTAPVATRYIYAPEYLKEELPFFNFPANLLIPCEFAGAMDEAAFMPWVYLQREMAAQGRDFKHSFAAFTVELGGEEILDFEQGAVDAGKILHYLKAKGCVSQAPDFEKGPSRYCLLKDFRTYHAPRGGLYDFLAAPGDEVKAGEVLAWGLVFEEEPRRFEVKAKQDCVVVNRYPSGGVNQGDELFQVMENFQDF